MVFVDLCQEACGGMCRYICCRLLDERCVICWEQVSISMCRCLASHECGVWIILAWSVGNVVPGTWSVFFFQNELVCPHRLSSGKECVFHSFSQGKERFTDVRVTDV